jgi:glycosyltransferase involved in cell wall biosynthesis
MPFISICIPSYKRTDFLRRLLDSIAVQTFRDFEVVLTDDSPGQEVQDISRAYAEKFTLIYHRNQPALGTPENWNEGIRRASGQWIKLMHDDDWFAGPDSLQAFADAVNQHPRASFFFSAYRNVMDGTQAVEDVYLNNFRFKKLKQNPVTLFSSNVIGPPSVTMHRNDKKIWYDRTIKWVVDIDFYIRYLQHHKPVYINKPLVHVGINAQQVTRVSFRQPEVEIPENFYLLDKAGTHHLKNILVYDAWWRLVRNLDIRNEAQVRREGYTGPIPAAVLKMMRAQRKISPNLLKKGVFSKMFMFASYLFNRP